MEPIRTLIVDDEEIAREGMAMLLAGVSDFEVVGMSKNGKEALQQIQNLKPDLILLDIQMPEWSGFEVLKRIPKGYLPAVIFVTAYDEYALEAFEVQALDYLLKPVSQSRLNQALDRIRMLKKEEQLKAYGNALLQSIDTLYQQSIHFSKHKPSSTPSYLERIMVKEQKRIHLVEVADIDWIEGADYYVYLHTPEADYLYRERLKTLETRLDPKQFLRIHNSAIVNLNKIKEIQVDDARDYHVILQNGKKLKTSRRRKKQLLTLGEKLFGLKVR